MNVRKTELAGTWPDVRSEQSGFLVGAAVLVLVLFLDYAAGSKVGFAPFYVFAIAIVAWTAPSKVGGAATAVAVLAATVRSFGANDATGSASLAALNALGQASLFLLTFLLVSNFQSLKRNLQQQVRERTRELQTEISDRRAVEEQLHKSLQQLRQLADNIGDVFWMRNAGELRIGYVSPAYEKIWGRPCRELYQSPELWTAVIHEEDRERVMNAMRTGQMSGEYNEEFRIVRPDGSLRWIRDRSFPIRTSAGAVFRIVGISEDVTVRRRLEREILEISDREQARIGQDLHDSLCQRLVTLAFDVGRLENDLISKSRPEVRPVRRMAQLIDDLISEARATARGLFPVHIEADGLHHSLHELAASITCRAGLDCRLTPAEPVPVRDGAVAMQLYRIAQEAIANALKHSHASEIRIRLAATDQRVEVEVRDNGIGIALETASRPGMGLHIMEYRARAVGGTLSVTRDGGKGTVVRCVAPQSLG